MGDLKELADEAAKELLKAIRDQARKASDLTYRDHGGLLRAHPAPTTAAYLHPAMRGKRWYVSNSARLTGRGHLFETCGIPPTRRAINLDRNQGLNDYVFDLSCRHGSGVAGCFLGCR